VIRPAALVASVAGAALFTAAGYSTGIAPRTWNFSAYLDDAPIGYHRFTLREDSARTELRSEARFEVKVMFITVYLYAHDAVEQWRGNCLESLTSRTDSNGDRQTVAGTREGAGFAIATGRSVETIDGCVMSFAYWNPAMLGQSQLLNSQTGKYEQVRIVALGEEKLSVRGEPVNAKRYRITGPRQPIDLWYSTGDEWLGLESTVAGGRRLRYRLD
jgi:hypothetical protein